MSSLGSRTAWSQFLANVIDNLPVHTALHLVRLYFPWHLCEKLLCHVLLSVYSLEDRIYKLHLSVLEILVFRSHIPIQCLNFGSRNGLEFC